MPRAPVGRLSDRTSETSKPAGRAQLLFHPDAQVAKPGGHFWTRPDLAEIVRNIETQLGFGRHSETQQCLRAIQRLVALG